MNKIIHYIACHLSVISINYKSDRILSVSTINGFKLSTLVALLYRGSSDCLCVCVSYVECLLAVLFKDMFLV